MEMDIEQVKAELAQARLERGRLQKNIDKLREYLRSQGVNPDPEQDKTAMYERNKEMYREWKQGKTFAAIAKKHSITAPRASSICHLIEVVLKQGRGRRDEYQIYKSLLDIGT